MPEVELQDNCIWHEGEKPKGYGTVVSPQERLHDAVDVAIRDRKRMRSSIWTNWLTKSR
jgi:hypothetical protein